MADLSTLRAEMDVTERWTYLDHAAVTPLPRRTRDAMKRYLEELGKNGDVHYPDYVLEGVALAIGQGAMLLSARPDQCFVVRSTTQGLAIAATGIPMSAGDNVVLVEGEFPANIRPWLPLGRRGIEVRRVAQRDHRVLIDDLAAVIDDRTRAVSVSYVQFGTGFRIELAKVAELCRRHDALFVVDAIQGLGPFPVNVEKDGVDFLSADSHKWLFGPEGVGLGFASDRALERIVPSVEGWLGTVNPFDFTNLDQPLSPTALRFHEGALNVGGVRALAASLGLFLDIGVPAFTEQVLSLTTRLCEGLAKRGWTVRSPRETAGESSGIVSTTKDGVDMEALATRLKGAGFVVSVRAGAMRVSPHGYNTADEIDGLVEALP